VLPLVAIHETAVLNKMACTKEKVCFKGKSSKTLSSFSKEPSENVLTLVAMS
jgi:hypothetical protein